MPRVIGLTGKAGHGKDTVADELVSLGFTRVSFAAPLKDGVVALFGIDQNILNDRVLKEKVIEEWGKSPRELMQWLGTDILRTTFEAAGINFFVVHAMKKIKALIDLGLDVVITDCRFDDEAEMVNANGGEVWLIDASERLCDSVVLHGSTAIHASERGVSKEHIFLTFDNNCSLEDLKRLIKVHHDISSRSVVRREFIVHSDSCEDSN